MITNPNRIERLCFLESILEKEAILVVRGTLSVDDYSGRKIIADSVETLDTIRQKHKPTLRLQVENNREFVADLCQALTTNKGGEHNVVLCYTNAEGAVAQMAFSDNYRIHITEALLDRLEQTPGLTAYDIVYA